jgi:tetratricopeptide (TPR) repeat protein
MCRWLLSYQVENLLAIRTEIAQANASALQAALTPEEEQELRKLPTDNLEAYDSYLRGRYFWHQRSLAGFDSAIGYFNQAIFQDPDYATAHQRYAELLGVNRRWDEAVAEARRAVELDPMSSKAITPSPNPSSNAWLS